MDIETQKSGNEGKDTGPCIKCNAQVPVDAVRCPHCGFEPDEWKKKLGIGPRIGSCVHCSEEILTTEKTCPECGYARPIWVRAIGHLLVFYGVAFLFTVVGIPLGIGLLWLGQSIKYPVSLEMPTEKTHLSVVEK